MAILDSKDLRTPKKSYLQWGSTWCKGLLLIYESNTIMLYYSNLIIKVQKSSGPWTEV